MKVIVVPIVIRSLGTVKKGLVNELEDLKTSIIKIGQDTEKSPGDLRWLAVTQSPLRNYQITLLWKTLKKSTMIVMMFYTREMTLTGRL